MPIQINISLHTFFACLPQGNWFPLIYLRIMLSTELRQITQRLPASKLAFPHLIGRSRKRETDRKTDSLTDRRRLIDKQTEIHTLTHRRKTDA